jgi:acyl-CoA thioesterase
MDEAALDAARQAMIERAAALPFFKLIGLEIVDLRPGWSKTRIAFRHDLCQPAQIMHGGIIATLIDTGIAYALLLSDAYLKSEHSSLVSVDLRVKYLRPVSDGVIYCESTIPRMGRQIIHAESIVTNEAGKEVARGDSIYMVVSRDRLRAEGSGK